MKIIIDINTDSAAFQDNDYYIALADITNRAAQLIADGQREGNLRDDEGNRVGKFAVKGRGRP